METAPLHNAGGTQAELSVGVETFFDTIRKEHERFLDQVGRAQSLLGHAPGALAQVSAIQLRLTRQFLDAQRSILARRGQVDAEIARFASDAEQHAIEVVAVAQARVGGDFADHVSSAATNSATVVGDPFAVESLQAPDGAVFSKQLTLLLDNWWHAERSEGAELIESARDRAAVRRNLADIEAGEIIHSATPLGHLQPEVTARQNEPISYLPVEMLAILRTAPARDLRDLLAALSAVLDPVVTLVAAPAYGDMIIRLEPLPDATGQAADDPFRHFWGQKTIATRQSGKQAWGRIVMRVLVPMTVVTSAFSLLMAWMG